MVILAGHLDERQIHPVRYPRTSTFASRLRAFATKIRLKIWLAWIGAFLVVCLAVFIELQTSILQSWIFTSTNQRLSFTLKDSPSKEIALPRAGRSTNGAAIPSCHFFDPG